jgi:gluconolactonase
MCPINDDEETMREIASDLKFPEGPVAMADGSVVLVEIAAGALTRVMPDGTKQVVATPGGGPNGAAIGPDGKCYVCNNGGFKWHEETGQRRPILQAEDYSGGRIERIDLETGAVEVLYTGAGDVKLRGPNDIVFDAHGGFWFSDLGKTRARDWDRSGVWYAKAGSLLTDVAFPRVTANGVGLSPAGDRLYAAETQTGRLWAFEITGPGEIRRDPWPSPNGGRVLASVPGYQNFDSLAVDADGNICVATLFSGGITVISPDGEILDFVKMPDPYTTNICFGGPDLKTAFITLSMTGKLVAVEWKRAGLKLNYQEV